MLSLYDLDQLLNENNTAVLPFHDILFPTLLFILTHFIPFDSTSQAESLDQPTTIFNQVLNVSTCSYLKNK